MEIKRDGAVIGDIQTARISIEDGAIFKGRIEIGRLRAKSGYEARKLSGIGSWRCLNQKRVPFIMRGPEPLCFGAPIDPFPRASARSESGR